ncbi:mitochondrial fission regulator 2-like isoform X2 [Ostrea edulis]|nr:mitochondrial fission regulator 2-like isoform X2 [Ostrea edulis]XP_056019097.1 mitochondrial fission regulator 2-like isoform X2 [Ostrea edulis]XP_056019098.1 mitochondrial fission regulator 2-like isoform X2 [Ostrea edulis]XP_056019100.1 mitochondrial fission regulator 2-like isoform X2 [Ostrea edulis]XP_056019101.1 mitochondrial fission regulator 2-like isoform X2 [Ostrea edulis]
MDVFEDVATILRIVLDYVGVDADDLVNYVQFLYIRGRDAQREFRGYICNRWDINVTQRRRHLIHSWLKWRSDIRHRSLVRILGTVIPTKPPKRLRIQQHLLRPTRRLARWSSDSSLVSVCTNGASEEDPLWVEEDLGNNLVRFRAKGEDGTSDTELESVYEEEEEDREELFTVQPGDIPLMNSTMISSVSMTSDPNAINKINDLQDELSSLRQQIAMLVINQEQINKSQLLHPSDMSSVAQTPSQISGVPPAPPPPPPPPLPFSAQNTSTPVKKEPSIDEVLKKKLGNIEEGKIEKRNTPDVVPTPTAKVPTMAEVLKGLNSVKLRSIQRSPGGTPLRPKVACQSTADPASMIALALQKKFANQHFQSPEVDKENENHDFSSADENSPHVPKTFAVKKSKRRSLLYEERRTSHSPLGDINL